jgi:signal transduction histidine kinase
VGSQEQAYSTFQALEQLNFASNKRVERRRQEQEVKLARRSDLPSSPRSRPTEFSDSTDADDAFSRRSDPEREARPGRSVADAGAADDAGVRALGAASAAFEADLFARAEPVLAEERPDALEEPVGDAPPSSETVRIAIDPMTGVVLPTSDPMLALYRSVIVGAQGYRQGLIIDLEALGAMLEADVVQAGGLAGVADVSFSVAGATDPPTIGPGYSFDHRFAEPFDALTVRLDLRPLGGDADERQTLLALAGLVLVLTFGGLFVVDRMTRVVIDFAERRSNFVAAVSHELKTPLTSIRMYAEMLRDGLVSGEQKRGEYLATISDESERLTRLIDNVLEFSRLEKGRADLALVAGDVAGPIREAVRRLTPFAEREGFALRVEVEPDLPPVLFERDALLQVAFNLIDNAIKYAAAAARREIIVRVVRRGEGVEVTVRDFGPGVPQGALRRVFEPFHRGQHELTRSAKGTGIGLALVAELAAAMRARVVGERPDGGGFLVRLTFAGR